MTDRWRRVNDLFHQARERPPEARAAFLAEATADDPELGREVQSLLEAENEAGDFLETPAVDVAVTLLDMQQADLTGRQLGPYRVEAEAGRGGMGIVYVAEDTRLGRKVAVKALAPEFTRNERRRERLRLEARAAANLSHPGIATVFALEEFDGHLYIVSEYVKGRTVRTLVEDGALDVPTVLDIGAQIARALAAAHAAGVTHRDLKPENVICTDQGLAKILDFGVARLAAPSESASERRLTDPGTILGTPAYMSPEQIEARPVDYRSDIFSIGVLLYEMASGRHPFEGTSRASTTARILAGEAAPLPQVDRRLPAELDRIVQKCLRKRPEERYQSAADVAVDLEHLQRGPRVEPKAGVSAVPPGPARFSPRWWWRVHQVGVMLVYGSMVYPVWRASRWTDADWMVAVFYVALVTSAVNGVLRMQLLFTERFNAPAIQNQLRDVVPWVRRTDAIFVLALLVSAVPVARTFAQLAALLAAVAVGAGVTFIIVEPETTRAAFARRASGARKRPTPRKSGGS